MQFTRRAGRNRAFSTQSWVAPDTERQAMDDVLSAAITGFGPTLAGPVVRVLNDGKRLRPALTITAAGERGRECIEPAVLSAAAAVELLHWATLVHDDVIDGARARHGQPTLNAREGLGQAVVTGDLLIGAAFELGASAGPDCVQMLAQTLTRLGIGQAGEDGRRFDPSVDEDDVLDAIRGKTGSLLATAGRMGGLTGGLDAETTGLLGEFGLAFGISLQLLDDVLDLVSSSERLGKPVLADFASGTITLPGVAALRVHPELREYVRPDLSPAEHDRAVELLRDPEALGYAMARAVHHADLAADTLRSAPDIDTNESLRNLATWPADYVANQLKTKVEPSLRPLLDGVPVRARQPA